MGIRDGEQILEMMRAYQVPCLLAAAADLDLFEKLTPAPRTASEVAAAAGCDLRAVTILLDALAAVGVIVKQDEQYSITPELAPFLCDAFSQSVVAILRHQANCLRRWSRLPWTVRSGKPEYPGPSIRVFRTKDGRRSTPSHIVEGHILFGHVSKNSPSAPRHPEETTA